MKRILFLVLLLAMVNSAVTFDIEKCVSADHCYTYCENAINEYKNITIANFELYANSTNSSIAYLLEKEMALVGAKQIISIVIAGCCGILLGMYIGLTLIKQNPPQIKDINKNIRG